jgi:hypothetical protein
LVVVIIYTIASLGQWDAVAEQLEQTQAALGETRRALLLTGRQTKAAEVSAEAAQQALRDSQNALELDQRAYVVLDKVEIVHVEEFVINNTSKPINPRRDILKHFTAGDAFTAVAHFKNIGKSPARSNLGFVNLQFSERPNDQAVDEMSEVTFRHAKAALNNLAREDSRKSHDLAPQQPEIIPAYVYRGGEGRSEGFGGYMALTPVATPRLFRGEVALIVSGVYSYSDIFGMPHETQFCIFYATEDAEAYQFCAAHNTIG